MKFTKRDKARFNAADDCYICGTNILVQIVFGIIVTLQITKVLSCDIS